VILYSKNHTWFVSELLTLPQYDMTITHIRLQGVTLDSDLLDGLGKCCNLKTLAIEGCEWFGINRRDADSTKLADFTLQCFSRIPKSVTKLDIEVTQLSLDKIVQQQTCVSTSRPIAGCSHGEVNHDETNETKCLLPPNLEELTLFGNGLNLNGVETSCLFSILPKSLSFLNLSDNSLTLDETVQPLELFTKLEKLDLWTCNLGIDLLRIKPNFYPPNLKELYLAVNGFDMNEEQTNVLLTTMPSSLKHLRVLPSISLSNNFKLFAGFNYTFKIN